MPEMPVMPDPFADRMLTMVYGAARECVPPRVAARLTLRVLAEGLTCGDVVEPGGRAVRARLLDRLRDGLARRCQRRRVDEAISRAVLTDELGLLPRGTREAVRLAAFEGRSTAEIAAGTGRPRSEVNQLLRSGMATLTAQWSRLPESVGAGRAGGP